VGIVVLSAVCQFLPALNTAIRFPSENFLLAGALGVAVLRTPRTVAAHEPAAVAVA
jgi:hypothetical protein